jgi:hypothetical protein
MQGAGLIAECIGVAFACALHLAFCIEWSPRLVSRQPLLGFSEALIYLSYLGMVVPAGNAPASVGYRPTALLLSYGTNSNRGLKPNPREGLKTSFSPVAGFTRSGL